MSISDAHNTNTNATDPEKSGHRRGEPRQTMIGVEIGNGAVSSSVEHVIEVRKLTTAFDDFVVHENLDLSLRKGEILGVVGGSGTGKSVLMRAIIGLKRPAGGQVKVFGDDFYASGEKARLAIEKRWGVLFQGGALFSSLTVAQNVMAPIREHLGLPDALALDIAAMKISMSGLPPEAGAKYPSELSGGMRKRAGLARALALDPEIVFLDEPTAGLDPIGAAKFDELIVSLKNSLGLTVFMVTHDLDTLHAACDRVAVLAEKRVIEIGPLPSVRASRHPWITEYFSGPRGRAALNAKDFSSEQTNGTDQQALGTAD